MKDFSKIKSINNIISLVSMLSFVGFLLHHYQYINFQVFDFDQKGYFILAIIALSGLLISDVIEVKITLALEKKVKVFSVIVDIILFALLLAFVWYIYTLPIGVCPIRAIMGNVEGFKEIPLQ